MSKSTHKSDDCKFPAVGNLTSSGGVAKGSASGSGNNDGNLLKANEKNSHHSSHSNSFTETNNNNNNNNNNNIKEENIANLALSSTSDRKQHRNQDGGGDNFNNTFPIEKQFNKNNDNNDNNNFINSSMHQRNKQNKKKQSYTNSNVYSQSFNNDIFVNQGTTTSSSTSTSTSTPTGKSSNERRNQADNNKNHNNRNRNGNGSGNNTTQLQNNLNNFEKATANINPHSGDRINTGKDRRSSSSDIMNMNSISITGTSTGAGAGAGTGTVSTSSSLLSTSSSTAAATDTTNTTNTNTGNFVAYISSDDSNEQVLYSIFPKDGQQSKKQQQQDKQQSKKQHNRNYTNKSKAGDGGRIRSNSNYNNNSNNNNNNNNNNNDSSLMVEANNNMKDRSNSDGNADNNNNNGWLLSASLPSPSILSNVNTTTPSIVSIGSSNNLTSSEYYEAITNTDNTGSGTGSGTGNVVVASTDAIAAPSTPRRNSKKQLGGHGNIMTNSPVPSSLTSNSSSGNLNVIGLCSTPPPIGTSSTPITTPLTNRKQLAPVTLPSPSSILTPTGAGNKVSTSSSNQLLNTLTNANVNEDNNNNNNNNTNTDSDGKRRNNRGRSGSCGSNSSGSRGRSDSDDSMSDSNNNNNSEFSRIKASRSNNNSTTTNNQQNNLGVSNVQIPPLGGIARCRSDGIIDNDNNNNSNIDLIPQSCGVSGNASGSSNENTGRKCGSESGNSGNESDENISNINSGTLVENVTKVNKNKQIKNDPTELKLPTAKKTEKLSPPLTNTVTGTAVEEKHCESLIEQDEITKQRLLQNDKLLHDKLLQGLAMNTKHNYMTTQAARERNNSNNNVNSNNVNNNNNNNSSSNQIKLGALGIAMSGNNSGTGGAASGRTSTNGATMHKFTLWNKSMNKEATPNNGGSGAGIPKTPSNTTTNTTTATTAATTKSPPVFNDTNSKSMHSTQSSSPSFKQMTQSVTTTDATDAAAVDKKESNPFARNNSIDTDGAVVERDAKETPPPVSHSATASKMATKLRGITSDSNTTPVMQRVNSETNYKYDKQIDNIEDIKRHQDNNKDNNGNSKTGNTSSVMQVLAHSFSMAGTTAATRQVNSVASTSNASTSLKSINVVNHLSNTDSGIGGDTADTDRDAVNGGEGGGKHKIDGDEKRNIESTNHDNDVEEEEEYTFNYDTLEGETEEDCITLVENKNKLKYDNETAKPIPTASTKNITNISNEKIKEYKSSEYEEYENEDEEEENEFDDEDLELTEYTRDSGNLRSINNTSGGGSSNNYKSELDDVTIEEEDEIHNLHSRNNSPALSEMSQSIEDKSLHTRSGTAGSGSDAINSEVGSSNPNNSNKVICWREQLSELFEENADEVTDAKIIVPGNLLAVNNSEDLGNNLKGIVSGSAHRNERKPNPFGQTAMYSAQQQSGGSTGSAGRSKNATDGFKFSGEDTQSGTVACNANPFATPTALNCKNIIIDESNSEALTPVNSSTMKPGSNPTTTSSSSSSSSNNNSSKQRGDKFTFSDSHTKHSHSRSHSQSSRRKLMEGTNYSVGGNKPTAVSSPMEATGGGGTNSSAGSVISWKKGRKIGEGSFGVVFQGANTVTGELLAVKQLVLADGSREEVNMLQKEIEVMWDLSHVNIVRYVSYYII